MLLNTHYDNLKVARNAPSEVIRAAYKVLAQRYHPDKNPSPDAQRIMKTINEAYYVLSDPRRRAAHDAWIDEQLRTEGLNDPLYRARTQKSNRYAPPPQSTNPSSPPPPSPPPTPTTSDTPRHRESRGGGGGTRFDIWPLILGGVFLILLWASGISQKTSAPGQRVPESNTMAISSSAPLPQAMGQPQSALPATTASLGQQLPEKTPSGTLSIEYPATDESRSLLPLICEERNIVANYCKQARNYPGGNECPVELQPNRFEGRFLSANSLTIIVGYLSECEPHANNWGGSLVFEKQGRAITFIGYLPGFVVVGCTPITKSAGKENLICTTSYSGQGHLITTVGEAEFTQDTKGTVEVSYDSIEKADSTLVEMADSTLVEMADSTLGVNSVNCNADFQIFNLRSPKPGPAPDTVIVEASYADAATIRRACAPDAEPLKIQTLSPPPPGEAYIDERDTSGQLIVDLTTRKIMPVSDFRRR